MAILAGDALLNYAFETASKAFCGDAQDITTAKAMQILAKKPGIYGMIGGQTVDVEEENKEISFDTLMYIHNNKIAALLVFLMSHLYSLHQEYHLLSEKQSQLYLQSFL